MCKYLITVSRTWIVGEVGCGRCVVALKVLGPTDFHPILGTHFCFLALTHFALDYNLGFKPVKSRTAGHCCRDP